MDLLVGSLPVVVAMLLWMGTWLHPAQPDVRAVPQPFCMDAKMLLLPHCLPLQHNPYPFSALLMLVLIRLRFLRGAINIPVVYGSAAEQGFGDFKYHDRIALPSKLRSVLALKGLFVLLPAYVLLGPIWVVVMLLLPLLNWIFSIEKKLAARSYQGNKVRVPKCLFALCAVLITKNSMRRVVGCK